MIQTDAIVIGAGVVGLSCARALAVAGICPIVIERHSHFGFETSSRNSEVIHAGIYYKPHSLKAQFCIDGSEKIYKYCKLHNINHKKCGKLIVASDEFQINNLLKIEANAIACGIENLRLLDKKSVREIEPNVSCAAALYSEDTGIISSHEFMLNLIAEAENNGSVIAYATNFKSAHPVGDYIDIVVENHDSDVIRTKILINCAGLNAFNIAKSITNYPSYLIPKMRLAKGSYFSLAGASPFKHLIYPIPESGGLGVHATLDLEEKVRFGPDVEWIDNINYNVDENKKIKFCKLIKKYWNDININNLMPAYSGIRPKIDFGNGIEDDFVIQGPSTHGIPGLVNLFGIDSPGLTSALSIADYIARKILHL